MIRLALVVGVPPLFFWSTFQWLAFQYRTGLHLPAGTAELLATLEMNAWVESVPGIAVVVALGIAVSLVWAGLTAPGPRVRRLRTRRLVLRRARQGDLADMHALLSDAETLRYWDHLPHRSMVETQDWLDRSIALPPETSDDFVIVRDGRMIGILGSRQWPWVTFVLRRDEWGKGYGGEALAAFKAYAFDRGIIRTLFVATDLRNAASLGMLRKTGFAEYARGPLTHAATGETVEAVTLRADRPTRWRLPRLRAPVGTETA